MVLPPGEKHGVGGGLRSLTAFVVKVKILQNATLLTCEVTYYNKIPTSHRSL